MFSTEVQEREYRGISEEEPLKTRLMYFDLIRIIDWPKSSAANNRQSSAKIHAILCRRLSFRPSSGARLETTSLYQTESQWKFIKKDKTFKKEKKLKGGNEDWVSGEWNLYIFAEEILMYIWLLQLVTYLSWKGKRPRISSKRLRKQRGREGQ